MTTNEQEVENALKQHEALQDNIEKVLEEPPAYTSLAHVVVNQPQVSDVTSHVPTPAWLTWSSTSRR